VREVHDETFDNCGFAPLLIKNFSHLKNKSLQEGFGFGKLLSLTLQ